MKPNNPGPMRWVLEKEDLQDLFDALREAPVAAFDLETTGLDEHAITGGESNRGVAARIVMASLTLPQSTLNGPQTDALPITYVIPLSHPRSPFRGRWRPLMKLLAESFRKNGTKLVGHHLKFDLRWIYAHTGHDLADLFFWDTQMSSHLIDETRPTALKERVPEELGVERWDDHDLSYPGAAEEIDFWELGNYAARDTYWTYWLYKHHERILFLDGTQDRPMDAHEASDYQLGKVFEWVSMPTARSLTKIEQRGITLDVPFVEKERELREKIVSRNLDYLSQTYGLPREGASVHATAAWFKDLTGQAVESGELRIAALTPNGNPKWDKHVLAKQARNGSGLAGLLLETRQAAKENEFLTSWLEKVTSGGLIHSTYRAGHVATGRLSSQNPNFQQISKPLRPAFVPRPGMVLADIDYSQLELRVAAYVSRSQPMIEAFQRGDDLHSRLAADIETRRLRQRDPEAEAVRLEEVTSESRQSAKAANFGLLYLQQAQGFRSYAETVYGVQFTEEEAQEVYDGFFETWEGMSEWHEHTIRESRARGYTVSPIGRRRLLPDIRDRNQHYRQSAERQAVNAPVQGFGSDLMQMAIASIFGFLPGTEPVHGAYPVATVHDSLVIEAPEDDWERVVQECIDRMIYLAEPLAHLGVAMDVPLAAEAVVGTRWSLTDVGEM